MKILVFALLIAISTLLVNEIESKEMKKKNPVIIGVECMNNTLYNVWKEKGKILWFPALDKDGNMIVCKEK